MNLEEALKDFYTRPAQASNRMQAIQGLLRDALADRLVPLGKLAEVQLERPLRGKHRSKNWDVVVYFAGRAQLAVSTKSIMKNVSGTVPNRIDDAMGECVNAHAHDPGLVLGFLFVMSQDLCSKTTKKGVPYVDILADSLASFSGRRSEADSYELFEAATLLMVNFAGPTPVVNFHEALLDWDGFFDVLVGQMRGRNPLMDAGLR